MVTSLPHSNDAAGGFTLVELVMAVAIISGAFLTLLYMRTDAVDRAFTYNHQRLVERVSREVLDEVAFGLSDGLEGTAQLPGHPDGTGWPWSATITDISREEVGPRLLEIELTLEHPGSNIDDSEEFVISTRILVAEDDPIAADAQLGSQFGSGSGF
ncbi:MAG: type II secretion system protein [Planctomycetota bacterium]|nr:type II secretion system protein [Planctomycetota bacterium]